VIIKNIGTQQNESILHKTLNFEHKIAHNSIVETASIYLN